MIMHIIPSMGLALEGCKFENGLLNSAYVVNGHWFLVRIGSEWCACSDPDNERVESRWEIKEDDNKVINVEQKMYGDRDYNEALSKEIK